MSRPYTAGRREILTGGSAAFLLAAVGAPGRAAATAPDESPHKRQLYEAARREGELTWYMSHTNDVTAQALGRGFESAYPGIRVNVVRTTAQVVFQRVSQELRAGAVQVDVFSSSDVGHHTYLKKRGLLEPLAPENAGKVFENYRHYDPDGCFFVTAAALIGMAYNSARLKETEVPGNWTGLADPKWNDRIALAHPAFSGFIGVWALTLRKLYGWKFFEDLAKNHPQVGRSINDTVTMLNAGERLIAGTALSGTVGENARKGNPVSMIFPSDGSVLVLAPSAVLKGARHPNAARLFMEYLLGTDASKVWVEHFGEPLRPEVSPSGAVKSARDLKTIRPSVPELIEGTPEVIRQWRETFGV